MVQFGLYNKELWTTFLHFGARTSSPRGTCFSTLRSSVAGLASLQPFPPPRAASPIAESPVARFACIPSNACNSFESFESSISSSTESYASYPSILPAQFQTHRSASYVIVLHPSINQQCNRFVREHGFSDGFSAGLAIVLGFGCPLVTSVCLLFSCITLYSFYRHAMSVNSSTCSVCRLCTFVHWISKPQVTAYFRIYFPDHRKPIVSSSMLSTSLSTSLHHLSTCTPSVHIPSIPFPPSIHSAVLFSRSDDYSVSAFRLCKDHHVVRLLCISTLFCLSPYAHVLSPSFRPVIFFIACVMVAIRAVLPPLARWRRQLQRYNSPRNRSHLLAGCIVPWEHCGALHWIEERVSGSAIGEPRFSLCALTVPWICPRLVVNHHVTPYRGC